MYCRAGVAVWNGCARADGDAELRTLPGAAVREHRRARRAPTMIDEKLALRSDGGSWRELLAALALFLLLGIAPSLLGLLPLPGGPSIVFGIAVLCLLCESVLALGILGLAKGLPRWVLPYGGTLLGTVTAAILGFLTWKPRPPSFQSSSLPLPIT
jgi:hypothetical protein